MATLVLIAGVASLYAWPETPKSTYATATVLLFGACQNAWRLLIC